MKEFIVPVKFIFEGEFKIKAKNASEAQELIEKHVGLCLGGNIHHTLDDEDIDWEFSTHSEKEIEEPYIK